VLTWQNSEAAVQAGRQAAGSGRPRQAARRTPDDARAPRADPAVGHRRTARPPRRARTRRTQRTPDLEIARPLAFQGRARTGRKSSKSANRVTHRCARRSNGGEGVARHSGVASLRRRLPRS
jgi:hypothetical protein